MILLNKGYSNVQGKKEIYIRLSYKLYVLSENIVKITILQENVNLT